MKKPRLPAVIDWAMVSYEISQMFEAGPILEEDMFAGRSSEVRRMLEAVLDRSRHVILFGERGVGKTSIANVFWKRYNKTLQTVIAARVQADPSDDFSSIWIRALEEFVHVSKVMGKDNLAPIDCDYSVVTPDTIRREFEKCRPNAIPIIIIDEYDQLKGENARLLTANVIKALYDYTVNVTIILVGVADDIHSLMEDHESLRRAISQIKLERMSTTELHELINKRTARLPIKVERDAQWTIVLLARGLPYYVQMLAKFSLQSACSKERRHATIDDVWVAMDRLVAEEEQSFKEDYRLAVDSPQTDNQFKQVLLACALADADDAGYFTPTNVLPKLVKITGKHRTHAHFQRHLNEFFLIERGEVLTRRGSDRRYSYRFTDPMMQPYVVIRGVKDGLIPKDLKSILNFPEQTELFSTDFGLPF